eukprot:TRINITY_DN1668_c0_g1_i4.p1 TRINITY_DN1668_c0_g1~~TRINITY_DN1668_c0_g1_i4.p1  ORF type:complete len:225 (+),score=10.55 TRINITY_DN1668_c0_g1_i4:177-851(+)
MSVPSPYVQLRDDIQMRTMHSRESASSHDISAIMRRCLHCQEYFTQAENSATACNFHPGEFDPQPSRLGLKTWSCCKQYADAIGCKAQHHVDDQSTAATIASHFPVKAPTQEHSAEAGRLYPSLGDASGSSDHAPVPGPTNSDARFIVHTVAHTDTLPGIALRYNVKAEDIARLNGLTPGTIHVPHKLIKIPGNTPLTTEELNAAQEASAKQMTEAKQRVSHLF